MLNLTPHECRVLGVLIEKAQTTPAQYPLTINAITTGANQKSNRHPMLKLSEDDVLSALDGLRSKHLSREVMLSGSRVEKHRHVAREALDIDSNELVILTELLLRGPQTVGELRGRASRMHPLESIEVVTNVLEHLMQRDEPYVARCAPAPGSRAPRFVQLLCPGLHPIDADRSGAAFTTATPASMGRGLVAESTSVGATGSATGGAEAVVTADLVSRIERLEHQVAGLIARLEEGQA